MLICAQYILPVTSDPIVNGAVLVRDGRIEDIGEASLLRLRHPGEEAVDYGQAAVMPGLVDLHTRLEKSVLRGVVRDAPYAKWILEVKRASGSLEASDWYDSAVLGGLDALSSGITTIADITSSGATFAAASKLGLRGVIYRSVAAMDKMRVDFAVGAAQREIERWRDKGGSDLVSAGIAPAPLFAIHPLVYTRVAEYAARENLPLALRLACSREEYNFVMHGASMFPGSTMADAYGGYVEIPPWLPTGVTPVRYAVNWGAFEAPNVMLVHGVHVDDADIKKLREYDVSVCTCPRANAQLGMGIAPLDAYLRAGLDVGFGTDSPAATDATDILTEMRVGMLIHRAVNTRRFLDAGTALKLATIGGARALGMDDRIGSLEIGKRADVIAVDLSSSHQSSGTNPVSTVVNACTASDVLMTMVDGKTLYEKNRWHVDVEVAKNIARVIETRTKLKI